MAPPPKKRPSTDELLRKWEADKKSRIFLQLAEEYRKTDFVDAALSVLKEGLKHHPNFQPAHVALARCYMSKSQWTEAQAELERVHAKSPDNLLAGKLLVEVLEVRGEKNQALKIAKELVPFAAFDDPEVEQTAKRLEAELAAPSIGGSGSSATTGGGDTMDFARSEATSEFGADATDATDAMVATSASAADGDEPMLIDADAFVDDEGGATELFAATPPPMPEDSPADATHDELSPADGDADADETHGELAAVGSDAAPAPMPGSEEPPPEDLLGEPEPAAPAAEDDDTTSRTLAELYEAQDSPHEAAEIYEKLLAKHPEDPELRAGLERCRARIEGGNEDEVQSSALETVESSSGEVPKWEPEPAAPAPVAAAPKSSGEEASPEQLQAMLAEYERWLSAVRAVRQ